MPIHPTFGPGSGWHRPGQAAPGSAIDRASMLEAAIPCAVVVLRRRGARIAARELLRQEPPTGWLLCLDRFTSPQWHACLFADQAMSRELLPRLMHAQLERENAGVRLYGGVEFVDNGRQEHRQSWLCTPSPAKARDILLEMLDREGG